jgi:hypothetical protein
MPVPNPGLTGATLPASPAAFAAYLNASFQGDNGHPGGQVKALESQGATGSTLGAQWLTWYARNHAQYGSGSTLTQYEEAFIVLWEDATLGKDLASGLAGGAAGAGALATSAATTAGTLGSIFSVLQSGALWLRIAEGILGIVLIAVGLAKLTGAVPIATKIASAVK